MEMRTCSLPEKLSSLGGARRVKKLLVTFSGFREPTNGLLQDTGSWLMRLEVYERVGISLVEVY